MKKGLCILIIVGLLLATGFYWIKPNFASVNHWLSRQSVSSDLSLSQKAAELQARLKQFIPEADIEVNDLQLSPVPDWLEVRYNDMSLMYLSKTGDYLFTGELIDFSKPEADRNLTENRRAQIRKDLLQTLSRSKLFSYPALTPDAKNTTFFVFVDPDCGYCRRFHQEIAKLNKAGISVYYIDFPRAGQQSAVYQKMANAHCAEDKAKAMDGLMKGEQPIQSPACAHPVDEHLALAEKLQIRGTPTVLLEDGRLFPGYRTAEEWIRLIQSE